MQGRQKQFESGASILIFMSSTIVNANVYYLKCTAHTLHNEAQHQVIELFRSAAARGEEAKQGGKFLNLTCFGCEEAALVASR